MRVSEAPLKARPRGAERLQSSFQGLFTDQESDACTSRAGDAPTRSGVGMASIRTAAHSARTPNLMRRPNSYERNNVPGDPFTSPTGGGRKNTFGVKSPAAPQSVVEANRHTNRPVYTAVGISTPTAANAPSSSKPVNSRIQASGSSASPGRRRRTQQCYSSQQLQDMSPKLSPVKSTPVGCTTSAVIAALAMDAALPDLDSTARALLETIMGGGGTPSPCQSPSLNHQGGATAGPGKSQALAVARSPLSPVAKPSASVSPHTAAAAVLASGMAADSARQTLLTKQILLQHYPALRQQYQSQAFDGSYAATSSGNGTGGLAGSAADANSSRKRGHQMQMRLQSAQQSFPYLECQLPSWSSQQCQYTSPQQHAQLLAAANTCMAGCTTEGSGSVKFKTPSTPPTPLQALDQFSALPPQLQELLKPTPPPHMQKPGSTIPPESSFVTSGEMGAEAKPHPGDELLQAPVRVQLTFESESLSRRRSLGSHSAATIHEAAAAAEGPSSSAVSGAPPSNASSSSSRALIKRLCRLHAAGGLSARMLKSPKDEPRRPITYTEQQGQGSPRLHLTQQHHDHPPPHKNRNQPPPQQQHEPLPKIGASLACAPIDMDIGSKSRAMAAANIKNAELPATTTNTTAAGAGFALEGRVSGAISCHDEERLSTSLSSAQACHGRFPGGSGRALPETISELGSSRSDSKTVVIKVHHSSSGAQQQQRISQTESSAGGVATEGGGGVASSSKPQQPKVTSKRGGGLFGGLFACFGFAGSTEKTASTPPPQPAPDLDDSGALPEQPSVQAAPPTAPALVVEAEAPPVTNTPGATERPRVAEFERMDGRIGGYLPPRSNAPVASLSTVAAVAAALSMSPTSAAAHVGADSRLLMLLQAELAKIEPLGPGAPTPLTDSSAATLLRVPNAANVPSGVPRLGHLQEDGTPQRTPRASSGSGAPQCGTAAPAPAVHQPLQSKNPVLRSLGNRQPPGVMPGSPDAPANVSFLSRSPIGPHPLRHEDGDSVLRGSVDVHTSVAANLSFSPGAPVSRSLPHTRTCSSLATAGVGAGSVTAPRARRQPLSAALEAAAAAAATTAAAAAAVGSGRSVKACMARRDFLEPQESLDRRDVAPESSQLSRQPLRQCPDSGIGLTPQSQAASHVHANLHEQVRQRLSGSGGADAACVGLGTSVGANAAVPALQLAGLSNSNDASVTTQQAPRSSRKRSRATHAGFSGSALSQLDARKLAAMPLEEMLERIQAAIVAEDMSVGQNLQQNGTSGGGLSDDCSILPMPPVISKVQSTVLRRRKSTAGGRVMGPGMHSGGGGGGNPSRGGRSSDGGTRGGTCGVGAVQTTLMKAATTAATLGSGRRRRRVKNRSPLAASRGTAQISNANPPGAPFYYFYSNQGVPFSSNGRKSDGSGNSGQPVWRHGGRALASNGFCFAGTTAASSSPRSPGYDLSFGRQPPNKKPQLCTPAAQSVLEPAIYTTCSASYGGATSGGAAVSPPRMRPSTTLVLSPPSITYTISPVTVKVPGVAHAPIRAARRILDVDDNFEAHRPAGSSAAPLTESYRAKAAGDGTLTAKSVPYAGTPLAPLTSCLSISELLSKCNMDSLAKSTGGAVTAVPAGDHVDTCKLVANSPGNLTKQHASRSECMVCRSVATMGGGSASPVATVTDTLLLQAKEQRRDATTQPVTLDSPGTGAIAEYDNIPQNGGSSSELNKPRMISISLSELLQQASVSEQQRPLTDQDCVQSARCSRLEVGLELDAVMAAELKERSGSISGAEKAMLPASDHADSTPPAAPAMSTAAVTPKSPRRHELRASKGASAPHALIHVTSAGGGTGEGQQAVQPTSTEPARSPAGYLELLQVYGQATGGRAAALPYCVTPAVSSTTGAAPPGCITATVVSAGGGGSPVRQPTYGPWPSAASASGRTSQTIGGYPQAATPRISPALISDAPVAAAAAAMVTRRLEVAPPSSTVLCDAAQTHAWRGQSSDYALADAASAAGSPAHRPEARGASPSTSSVMAQLHSAVKPPEAWGQESTAAVCSDGVQLLEDTADSGEHGPRKHAEKSAAADTDEMTARRCGAGCSGSAKANVAFPERQLEKVCESEAMPPELPHLLSWVSKHTSTHQKPTEESLQPLSETETAPQQLSLGIQGNALQLLPLTEDTASRPPSPAREDLALSPDGESAPQPPSLAWGTDTRLPSLQLEQSAMGLGSPLELDPTPQRLSGTPFGDVRCVPLDAYDDSTIHSDNILLTD